MTDSPDTPTPTTTPPQSGPPSLQPHPRYPRWIHWLAVMLGIGLFILIGIGGHVTTIGAGLSIEGGFYTEDYFTPLAPLDVWWDNVAKRWEHSHRLKGYVVGMLTIAMLGSIWLSRHRKRRWLKTVATLLFLGVVVQGVMGAFRITTATPGGEAINTTQAADAANAADAAAAASTFVDPSTGLMDNALSTALALLHGVLGQMLLGLAVVVAVATSVTWRRLSPAANGKPNPRGIGICAKLGVVLVAAILIQLVLGASVRRANAGLAIPDFPTSYAQWIPPTTQEGVDLARLSMDPSIPVAPYSINQIWIHFAHRVGAVLVLLCAVATLLSVVVALPADRSLMWPTIMTGSLLLLQIGLGILVVLEQRHPAYLPTLHQAIGAALLASAVWLTVRAGLVSKANRVGLLTESLDSQAPSHVGPAAGATA